MVGCGSDWVDGGLAEDPHEVDPICLQDPLLQCLVLAILVDDDSLLGVLCGVVHVHLWEVEGEGEGEGEGEVEGEVEGEGEGEVEGEVEACV